MEPAMTLLARIPIGLHRCGRVGLPEPCQLIAERTSTGVRYRCLVCDCVAPVKVIPALEQEFTPEIPASQRKSV
jgi:hypothetical protein